MVGAYAILAMIGASLCAAHAQTASPAPAAKSGPAFFMAAQASDGEAKYEHSCRACHGDHLDDGDFGGVPLRGSYFRSHWGSGDVAALFGFMKSQMPPDDPGGLNDESYADILAYILQVNNYPAGATQLPVDPAAQARLSLARPGG
jgi:mono/diheme cytochrome c family protein